MSELYGQQPAAQQPVAQHAHAGQAAYPRGDFLSSKHWFHMAAVVGVVLLMVTGFRMAFATWSGAVFSGTTGSSLLSWLGGSTVGSGQELAELYVGAALLVVGALLWFSDRQARKSLSLRPEYYMRAAYRVAVYGALALLVVIGLMQLIDILWVLISTLALIGVKGLDYKYLYLAQFVPALLGFVVSGGAAWYVWKLAKGRDNGAMMAMVYAVLSLALAVTLFVTGAVHIHKQAKSGSSATQQSSPALDHPSSSSSSSDSSNYNYSSPDYGSDNSTYDNTYGQ